MEPKALLRESLLRECECARCGRSYRGGYRYRGMGVCGTCARALSSQLKRER